MQNYKKTCNNSLTLKKNSIIAAKMGNEQAQRICNTPHATTAAP